MPKDYHFSGWATKHDVLCMDGRVIDKDAFKHFDGQKVPLIWNHQHDRVDSVLGHAILEVQHEGLYAYCTFNETSAAKSAREIVKHQDVAALSIYATHLRQERNRVKHGDIKEVSVCIAGANPKALIDDVIMHGDDDSYDAMIHSGILITEWVQKDDPVEPENIKHADTPAEPPAPKKEEDNMADKKDKTVQDVIDSMSEEQKEVMYAMVGLAIENADDEGDDEMKQNAFDQAYEGDTLAHSMDTLNEAVNGLEIQKNFTLQNSFLAHGITDIEYMFPDAKLVGEGPFAIMRDMEWVTVFMNAVKKVPFSRVKSLAADLTEDDARALGYIKGNLKVDQVFSLLKRTTTAGMVYKRQKLDRQDILEITEFNLIAFLQMEMMKMLKEEVARAALISDGRSTSSNDKIKEDNIRPIWTDEDFFTIKRLITLPDGVTESVKIKMLIDDAVRARKEYKGAGNTIAFVTEDNLTEALLLEDAHGYRRYKNAQEVADALRCSKIVSVPVMANQTRTATGETAVRTLEMIIVNPSDYAMGTNKGGEIARFNQFDIDYNQEKYLIETYLSGALVTPYSAIVLETTPKTPAAGG